jgi:hypothetical protein
MEKRGQVFLIAALVIVAIIIGVAAVKISTQAPEEDNTIYDLSEEIIYEGSRVADSGVFNALSQAQVETNIEDLIGKYLELNPDSNITVVYGDKGSAIKLETEVIQAATSTLIGSASVITRQKRIVAHSQGSPQNGRVKVKLDKNIEYDFDLQEDGKKFYIVIAKEKGGERIVASK